jgi:1,2-dihydroxy-3-keto-5-methylthiopentene dioxygenase
MSSLTIYADTDPNTVERATTDGREIAGWLGGIGVTFERWQTQAPLSSSATDDDVFAAYAEDIARLQKIGGYRSVDVVRLLPENPAAPQMRAKFLSEHRHSDDEVRFFVEGAGQFYLHEGGKVYVVLCEAGDLISVPAGTRHWFDTGAAPRFTAIRLFVSPDGWEARFTGDAIADVFPKYEAHAA